MSPVLIRQATIGCEIAGGPVADVRIADQRIVALASQLPPLPGEAVIEADGGALLPGLHDHHLHLYAAAAQRASVRCGPPEVGDAAALAAALHAADAALPGGGWLRGTGWHPAVMAPGETLDRDWLDRHGPARPIRIQHRSGRLWMFNSAALDRLQLDRRTADALGFQRQNGRLTGALLDGDAWLRTRLAGQRPDLSALSRALAARGVTALTDTTPGNRLEDAVALHEAQQRGALWQTLRLMGSAELDGLAESPSLQRGEAKFHHHEHALPPLETLVTAIRARHAAGRGVAFHCVSRIELVFTLAALETAGARPGDRIEHAGIAPPETVATMARLGLTVVSQPHFIRERGAVYRREVDADDRPWLYRLRGLQAAGIPLAAGSDAPFGRADPWASMQAAVDRRCEDGMPLGAAEALSPEAAFALYAGPLAAPGAAAPALQEGAPADLCLIDRPWSDARRQLAAVQVRGVCIEGRWRVTETPHPIG